MLVFFPFLSFYFLCQFYCNAIFFFSYLSKSTEEIVDKRVQCIQEKNFSIFKKIRMSVGNTVCFFPVLLQLFTFSVQSNDDINLSSLDRHIILISVTNSCNSSYDVIETHSFLPIVCTVIRQTYFENI
jgi:F0F1-type ATP synthase membrane subunit a